MNGAERITIACFDLAGTTLVDGDAVETAVSEAIATVGVVPGTAAHARAMSRVRKLRGRQEIEIFRTLFTRDKARAQAANLSLAAMLRIGASTPDDTKIAAAASSRASWLCRASARLGRAGLASPRSGA